jgi:hypothetical protein
VFPRSKALVAIGFFIVGIAFAIFPWDGVATAWAEQNSSSTAEVYQLVGLVAVALVGFGLILTGAHRSLPLPPFGFLAVMGVMAALAWIGIGMILGG